MVEATRYVVYTIIINKYTHKKNNKLRSFGYNRGHKKSQDRLEKNWKDQIKLDFEELQLSKYVIKN